MTKECPMCTELMRLFTSEREEKIPGTIQVARRTIREWRCPECDYFEEKDDEDKVTAD